MANTVSQKTFKIEIEFTVTMNEVGEQPLGGNDPNHKLSWLKHLQQALLNNQAALLRPMLSAIVCKLQEYTDYLAAQDDLTALQKVAAALESEDPECAMPEGDFAELTRPVRLSNTSAQINHSAIHEKVSEAAGENEWQPVWSDLLPETEIGVLLDQYCVPKAPGYLPSNLESSHHLLVRYLTRQRDGVHMEGRCTCQKAIEGVGEDEYQAFDALWGEYRRHIQAMGVAKRIQAGMESVFGKSEE